MPEQQLSPILQKILQEDRELLQKLAKWKIYSQPTEIKAVLKKIHLKFVSKEIVKYI